MSSAQVVTPIPEGSARSTQFGVQYLDATPLANSIMGRGGAAFANFFSEATNWGLSGEAVGSTFHRGGVWFRKRAGAVGLTRRIPIINVRPPFRTWSPISQLYRVTVLLSWPNNNLTSATENGACFAYRNFARVNTAGEEGFMLCNNAGVITLVVRGPTGIASTALAGLDPLVANKFLFEFRQPVSDRDGGLTIYANDSSAAGFTMSTADANWPNPVGGASSSGLSFFWGTRDANEFVHMRDFFWADGPDTTLGM